MSSIKSIFPGLDFSAVETKSNSVQFTALPAIVEGVPVFLIDGDVEKLFESEESNLYYFTNWSFSLDIDGLVFQNSLQNVVKISAVRIDAGDVPIFPNPITFNQVDRGREVDLYFGSNKEENIGLKCEMIINQTPEILALGRSELNVFVSVESYQVRNSQYFKDQISNPKGGN